VINSTLAGSAYISVEDLDSATAAFDNRPDTGTTQLSGGLNGSNPSTGEYSTALEELNQIVQAMIVNVPGNSNNTVITSAISYCETRGDAFLIVDTSSALTVSQAIAESDSLTESSYAAVYYPWVNAIDPASNSRGVTRLLPPGGFVAGIIVQTDLRFGPFKAPAGLGARIGGVVSTERLLTSGNRDDLNDAYVNAVHQHPTGGIVIFGVRTLSRTAATRYVNVRRNLIYIKDNVKRLIEFALFENNDETTWTNVQQRVAQFLTAWWQSGGLRGASAQEAFYVVCDETNNTSQTIDSGELHVEVGVSVEQPAEYIVINIGQWQGGQSASEA
jgi:phage tail sheath protein FI